MHQLAPDEHEDIFKSDFKDSECLSLVTGLSWSSLFSIHPRQALFSWKEEENKK